MSVPSSMRPVTSSVACAWIGTRRTPLANARVMPAIAAFISSRSWLVSSSSRSTPPSISAVDCSSYRSASSSNVIFDSAGSDDEISIPVGPSEPATNFGRSGVANASAARRAICADARLISCVFAPSPYSSSLSRDAVNESVSTTSAPAAK